MLYIFRYIVATIGMTEYLINLIFFFTQSELNLKLTR